MQPLPELTVQVQQKEPLQKLRQFIEEFDGTVIFPVETEGRRETLLDLLLPLKLKPTQIQDLGEKDKPAKSLLISSLEHGFIG